MTEAPVYQYQNRPRELVSSSGFSVEYDPRVMDQELYDDIISYLGEYRFALQKFDYSLEFSDNILRDSRRGEPMSIKAKRSVRERMMRGESINREAAEASGLNFLDKQLLTAEEGDSIVWASPSGTEEEGYDESYGFFFIGRIKRSIENKRQIQMTAIRVENPTLEQFRKAFKTLTNSTLEQKTAEDFLKTPLVVGGSLDQRFVDQILSTNFPFEMKPDQKRIFDVAMIRLKPRIDDFISMVRWGTKEEKKRAFHALENYSLQVKKELESGAVSIFEAETRFDEFVQVYGFEPPKVSGSCPIKSNNPLTQGFESLNKALNNEWFTCPNKKCGYKANGPVGDTCPGCGLTKEDYAKSGAVTCN